MGDAEALAQGAIERLYENEALRGELTDSGFGALAEWAAAALLAAAEGAAGAGGDAAARMDEAETNVKRLVGAIGEAAQQHTREAVRALMNDPAVARNPGARLRVAANGWRLGDDPDANAIRLTRALRGVEV